MTGVDADLATLRGIVRSEVRQRAADRVEAELASLREERDALEEAQQFPVETVMSWKRRAEAVVKVEGLRVAGNREGAAR